MRSMSLCADKETNILRSGVMRDPTVNVNFRDYAPFGCFPARKDRPECGDQAEIRKRGADIIHRPRFFAPLLYYRAGQTGAGCGACGYLRGIRLHYLRASRAGGKECENIFRQLRHRYREPCLHRKACEEKIFPPRRISMSRWLPLPMWRIVPSVVRVRFPWSLL